MKIVNDLHGVDKYYFISLLAFQVYFQKEFYMLSSVNFNISYGNIGVNINVYLKKKAGIEDKMQVGKSIGRYPAVFFFNQAG